MSWKGKEQGALAGNPYVSSVDGGTPPQRKATIWDLIETRSLCVGQLLELHRFLKTAGLLK